MKTIYSATIATGIGLAALLSFYLFAPIPFASGSPQGQTPQQIIDQALANQDSICVNFFRELNSTIVMDYNLDCAHSSVWHGIAITNATQPIVVPTHEISANSLNVSLNLTLANHTFDLANIANDSLFQTVSVVYPSSNSVGSLSNGSAYVVVHLSNVTVTNLQTLYHTRFMTNTIKINQGVATFWIGYTPQRTSIEASFHGSIVVAGLTINDVTLQWAN